MQDRRPPPERRMSKLPNHAVARGALRPATSAPVVIRDDAACDHGPIRLEPLADRTEPEPIEAGERGQIRGSKGSVKHVEVFQMGGVRTSILREPRPASDPPTPYHGATSATPSNAKSRLSYDGPNCCHKSATDRSRTSSRWSITSIARFDSRQNIQTNLLAARFAVRHAGGVLSRSHDVEVVAPVRDLGTVVTHSPAIRASWNARSVE